MTVSEVAAAGTASGRRAVIVVDCQNDFCEGGSLAVAHGAAAVARIAAHLATVGPDDVVVATLDAHVEPGAHFSASPDFVDSWPVHCVVGTLGAQPHSNLTPALGRIDAWFAKGAHEAAYSGFEGRSTTGDERLEDYLRRRRVERVDVVGLATDYCVAATASGAARRGFDVTVRVDLCAAVDPDHAVDVLAGLARDGIRIEGGRPDPAGADPAGTEGRR